MWVGILRDYSVLSKVELDLEKAKNACRKDSRSSNDYMYIESCANTAARPMRTQTTTSKNGFPQSLQKSSSLSPASSTSSSSPNTHSSKIPTARSTNTPRNTASLTLKVKLSSLNGKTSSSLSRNNSSPKSYPSRVVKLSRYQ